MRTIMQYNQRKRGLNLKTRLWVEIRRFDPSRCWLIICKFLLYFYTLVLFMQLLDDFQIVRFTEFASFKKNVVIYLMFWVSLCFWVMKIPVCVTEQHYVSIFFTHLGSVVTALISDTQNPFQDCHLRMCTNCINK